MKMYIPEIGSQLELEEDWVFNLFHESRNFDLWEMLVGHKPDCSHWCNKCGKKGYSQEMDSEVVVLPAKTILSVDRVYIRNKMKDFSSVSLKIIDSPNKSVLAGKRKTTRFWVKLFDYNLMRANVLLDNTKNPHLKPSKGNPISAKDFIAKAKKVTYLKCWITGNIGNTVVDGIGNVSLRSHRDYKTYTITSRELSIGILNDSCGVIINSVDDFLAKLNKQAPVVISSTDPMIENNLEDQFGDKVTCNLAIYNVDNL